MSSKGDFYIKIRKREYIHPNIHKMEVKIGARTCPESNSSLNSFKIYVNDRIEFRMKFVWTKYEKQYFVKFNKKFEKEMLNYHVHHNFECYDNKYQIGFFEFAQEFDVDNLWHHYADLEYKDKIVRMKFVVFVNPHEPSYDHMYDDNSFTDFELRGVDGSVRMHKAIAASCSPYFQTLFMKSSKEATENVISVPDVYVSTLQCLKEYMYLGKVSESVDLKQLIQLSSQYLMHDLELRCMYQQTRLVESDHLFENIRFAIQNNNVTFLNAITLRLRYMDIPVTPDL